MNPWTCIHKQTLHLSLKCGCNLPAYLSQGQSQNKTLAATPDVDIWTKITKHLFEPLLFSAWIIHGIHANIELLRRHRSECCCWLFASSPRSLPFCSPRWISIAASCIHVESLTRLVQEPAFIITTETLSSLYSTHIIYTLANNRSQTHSLVWVCCEVMMQKFLFGKCYVCETLLSLSIQEIFATKGSYLRHMILIFLLIYSLSLGN